MQLMCNKVRKGDLSLQLRENDSSALNHPLNGWLKEAYYSTVVRKPADWQNPFFIRRFQVICTALPKAEPFECPLSYPRKRKNQQRVL